MPQPPRRRDSSNWDPVRTIRSPDPRWEAAKRIAAERGQTMSEFVNWLLEREIRAWPGPPPVEDDNDPDLT